VVFAAAVDVVNGQSLSRSAATARRTVMVEHDLPVTLVSAALPGLQAFGIRGLPLAACFPVALNAKPVIFAARKFTGWAVAACPTASMRLRSPAAIHSALVLPAPLYGFDAVVLPVMSVWPPARTPVSQEMAHASSLSARAAWRLPCLCFAMPAIVAPPGWGEVPISGESIISLPFRHPSAVLDRAHEHDDEEHDQPELGH
jgi:hypothetical protein